MRRKKVNGQVLVGLTVDKNGLPNDVHIVRGLEKDFDAVAAKAVQKYRFSPAVYQRKPVVAEINIEVNFRIY
jgi:TonB family protein